MFVESVGRSRVVFFINVADRLEAGESLMRTVEKQLWFRVFAPRSGLVVHGYITWRKIYEP